MARRVQHLDLDVAQIKHLAIDQGFVVELHERSRAFVQTLWCANALGQFPAARKVIGMDMGVDDIGDTHVRLSCLFNEPILVARDHIDSCGDGVSRASKEIRQ